MLYPCCVYRGSTRPRGGFIGAESGWLNAVLVMPAGYVVFLYFFFPLAQHGLLGHKDHDCTLPRLTIVGGFKTCTIAIRIDGASSDQHGEGMQGAHEVHTFLNCPEGQYLCLVVRSQSPAGLIFWKPS